MKDQLIQYVSLLFAGVEDCDDIRQEILQNTLDRYDDLIAQGKSPEVAYRQAISGIGDINEILSQEQTFACPPRSTQPRQEPEQEPEQEPDSSVKKMMRILSIALFILCPVPVLLFDEFGFDNLGVCCTLAIAAVATALLLLGKKDAPGNADGQESTEYTHSRAAVSPATRETLHKGVKKLIWAIGLAAYFIVSFATGAWYITWVIFPIIGAVQSLAVACMDLMEGQ